MRDKDILKTACEFETLLLELNVLNLLVSSFQIAYFHQQMTRIGQMDFLLLCYPKQIFMFQAICGKAVSPRFKFWIIRFKEFFNLVLPNRETMRDLRGWNAYQGGATQSPLFWMSTETILYSLSVLTRISG